jgi:hypothetical protein
MTKPRGSAERRQKLARLPHVVQISIPPGGLGERLNEMHAWALKRCGSGGYAESGETERDKKKLVSEFAVFHFPDAQTARDFVTRFASIGAKLAHK